MYGLSLTTTELQYLLDLMYGLSLTTTELQYLKINLEDRKESLDDYINNEQIPKDVFNRVSKINSNILEKIAILLNSKERIIS